MGFCGGLFLNTLAHESGHFFAGKMLLNKTDGIKMFIGSEDSNAFIDTKHIRIANDGSVLIGGVVRPSDQVVSRYQYIPFIAAGPVLGMAFCYLLKHCSLQQASKQEGSSFTTGLYSGIAYGASFGFYINLLQLCPVTLPKGPSDGKLIANVSLPEKYHANITASICIAGATIFLKNNING